MRIPRAAGLCIVSFCVSSCLAATRHYYIAAEDVTWNYAPSGHNLLTGAPLPQPWVLKPQWPKTRFIEYTDDSFTIPKPQPEWLGILGPIIRAEVGDEVDGRFSQSQQAGLTTCIRTGCATTKTTKARFTADGKRRIRVAPGRGIPIIGSQTRPAAPGRASRVRSCGGITRTSTRRSKSMLDLWGRSSSRRKAKRRPMDLRKMLTANLLPSFMIFDRWAESPAGLFYSINGFIFGNLPGLAMKQGEKVRWHLLAMGNEIDLHTPHWHGETVTYEGRHTDVVELLPGSMRTVDMVADNPGTWMFHCHVEDHMEAGMMAVYTVAPPPPRACPVAFTGGDFWKHPENFALAVKNTSGNPISSLTLTSEIFTAPQYLRRPNNAQWHWNKTIAPGAEVTIEKPGIRAESAQEVSGWVFFPSIVKFEDGTTWRSESEGECFGVIWRDPQHPDLFVLPPRQIEMNPD